MSTRLLRANSSARDGVSNSSRFSLPSIWRTISASSRRLREQVVDDQDGVALRARERELEIVPEACSRVREAVRCHGLLASRSDRNVRTGCRSSSFRAAGSRPSRRRVGRGIRWPATRRRRGGGARCDPGGWSSAALAAGRPSYKWSGREDSNFRPPAPHAGALPGCATPRPKPSNYTVSHGLSGRPIRSVGGFAEQMRGFRRAPAARRQDVTAIGAGRDTLVVLGSDAGGGPWLGRLSTRAGGARR